MRVTYSYFFVHAAPVRPSPGYPAHRLVEET